MVETLGFLRHDVAEAGGGQDVEMAGGVDGGFDAGEFSLIIPEILIGDRLRLLLIRLFDEGLGELDEFDEIQGFVPGDLTDADEPFVWHGQDAAPFPYKLGCVVL